MGKFLCYNGSMEGLYALIAFIIGWLIAQVVKTILSVIQGCRTKEVTNLATMIGYFSRSGGMPSGHTASFTALCVYLGCTFGFTSAIFALGLATWSIIVYDAIHVRYAVGEQGKALNGLLKAQGKEELPIVEGHTVPQVIVGGVIGVAVGLIIYGLVNGF